MDENEIKIELPNSKMRLPNFKQAGCFLIPAVWITFGIVFSFNMTVNGVSQGWKLKTLALMVLLAFTGLIIERISKQRERKLFMQINPFLLKIYQINNGQKIILDSFPSYMIDQLSVKDTSGNNGKHFSLNILTKDH